MGTDTIAAIATAMTSSGIGIVRISGDEAVSITDRIFEMKKQKKLEDMPTHTIHYGHIHDGDEVIDEVMVVLMREPKSYTREDTVEIDCHGGVYVMKRILETVIKYGARPAEPGEFTKRAFLNGRIDLSQAESVIDVINSKNEFALKSSLSQLSGSVSEKIKEIRGTVLHEIAFIESALDDPEHISLDGYPEKLSGIVSDVIKKIDKLLANSDNGKMLKEGISTVIVGKPNAGKSSLLNSLVGEEKAIVTDIAGTTRDVLEEKINLLQHTETEYTQVKEKLEACVRKLSAFKPYEKEEYQANQRKIENLRILKSIPNPTKQQKNQIEDLIDDLENDKYLFDKEQNQISRDYKKEEIALTEEYFELSKKWAKIKGNLEAINDKYSKLEERLSEIPEESLEKE